MKIFRILYVQVLIGIAAGIVVGKYFPAFSSTAKLISDTFINLVKMMIGPIIFFTIVAGIAGAGELRRLGRIGLKSLVYFELLTTLALIIGLVVANLVRPGDGIRPPASASMQVQAQMQEISTQARLFHWDEFIAHIVPSNIVDAFARGDILQILFFSILFGVALKQLGAFGEPVSVAFDRINQVLFGVLKIIMRLSPLGAFGGMAYSIGKFGLATLGLLAKLLLTFYTTGILFIFVVLGAVMRLYGFRLWRLLGYIREEILIVLGASSSEAGLPSLMQKLRDAGCEAEVVGLVVPAGYSFNLDGTTVYLSLCVIFLAQVFHIDLSLGQQLTVIGILLLTSKGAAGVTGSGFIVLASTLTAMKVIPVEGLGLLIGVDRFMSEGRALINFIGNATATVVLSKSERSLDEAVYARVVEKR